MFRTLNAEIFNNIANNSEVRPFLGGTNVLDLGNIVNNPYNFCFLTECKQGGHIVIARGDGVYEVHTLSLPEIRGKAMLQLMQDARSFMFLQTDAIELQTFVPEGQPHTSLWANYAGFKEDFKRPKCFNSNGVMVGGTYCSLSYNSWVLKDKENKKAGEAFHSQIEKYELLTHEDDPVHDAWAGSVCRSLNLPKAVAYYNRWSSRTGYQALTILSFAPITVQMGSSILQQSDGVIYILDKEVELSINF